MSEALFAKWRAEALIKAARFQADRVARRLPALIPRKEERSRSGARPSRPVKSRVLTEQQAIEVLASGEAVDVLARRLNVFRAAVEDVRARRTWVNLMSPHVDAQLVKRMRITPEMKLAILADTGSNADTAARHGVSYPAVCAMRKKHREALKSQEVEQIIDQ